MEQKKVVVIEDEADIREVIEHNLSREGYEVHSSANGEQGLEMIRKILPDIVLLDLMLPGLDGLAVCRRIKADSLTRSISVVMVTAKGEESDIVLGLGVGADDYVTKPFSPRELVARVEAVLRRGPLKDEKNTMERVSRGELSIDLGRFEARIGEMPLIFTVTEMRLLHFLASYPGRVFTRDHLVKRVIGEDTYVVDRNIDVHIRSVRKKLGKYRNLIKTIRGVGYRFQDERE